MRALRWALALLMLIGLATAANGAEVAVPPSPTRWVTDTAGFLKPQTVAALDARLRAYQSATGHQVLVYVAPTTGDTPTEDWTVRTFARWKVGRKGLDDGLILFVFPNDHKVRIEVGYGLEQTVPDATAARIIRDAVTPKLRAGQPDEAVTAGVGDILGTVGGEARGTGDEAQGKGDVAPFVPPPLESNTGPDPVGVAIGILLSLLIVIGVIVTVARMPKGPFIAGRSRGGGGFWSFVSFGGDMLGGGFSGGGFSGGGGMSGGGGATGSW